MIIVKAPLRISLGGGGTDLPSYYENFESNFLSAAIDKYVYISIHETFIDPIIIKYSEMEVVDKVSQIKHPIIREALMDSGIKNSVEISSFADIPSGTGLGSSGSFTVALLKALYTFNHKIHDPVSLAEAACDLEINKLNSPVGKQDQFISSLGGLTSFHIAKDGKVSAKPLEMRPEFLTDLEEHLLLFFTGYSRSANELLMEQDVQSREKTVNTPAVVENLHFVKELGFQSQKALESGDLDEFAKIMNIHWEHKKKRSTKMSNPKINDWYELGMKNGALGGKLIGAGGGGFLMFLAEDKRKLRRAMRDAGLRDLPFRFDQLGARVVLRDV